MISRVLGSGALLFVATLLLAAGCKEHPIIAEPEEKEIPVVGSETHWLLSCTIPEECGEVSDCVCNVCAPPCESDVDCADQWPLTHCALPGTPSLARICGGLLPVSGGLCVASCDPDGALCQAIESSWDADARPEDYQLVCSEQTCTPANRSRSRAVDILWVVDNSGSMCEEQDALRRSFAAFIDVMVSTNLDFQMAVITTDMEDPLEMGRFQNVPDGQTSASCEIEIDVSDCPPPSDLPLIMASRDPRYRDVFGNLDGDKLGLDFGCIATTGTNGSGFEQGLEAAQTALSEPLTSTHNAGFLRDNANLAIIFVTDENDCSDRGALDKVNGNICEWEADQLVPVEEYIDFFARLKSGLFGESQRGRVVMAGIIAPDNGVRYQYGEDVEPACITETGRGFSSYRYLDVIESFPNSTTANICELDGVDSTLSDIAAEIAESFD